MWPYIKSQSHSFGTVSNKALRNDDCRQSFYLITKSCWRWKWTRLIQSMFPAPECRLTINYAAISMSNIRDQRDFLFSKELNKIFGYSTLDLNDGLVPIDNGWLILTTIAITSSQMVPNGQKHLGLPFWTLLGLFWPIWNVYKPAMFGHFCLFYWCLFSGHPLY